jgi:hypothetical protein
MLDNDIGKILEATFSSGCDVRLKVIMTLLNLCYHIQYVADSFCQPDAIIAKYV